MAAQQLITWLNEAYAMEQGQITALEHYSRDFARYPDIQQELHEHLAETHKQTRDIRACIQGLGGSISPAKALAGKAAGIRDTHRTGPFHNNVVKDLLALYAGEQFEYACYKALAEGARHMGEDETADICERIAEEEMAMAEWIDEQLPGLIATAMTTEEL